MDMPEPTTSFGATEEGSPSQALQKRVVRKLDLGVLPIITIICLLSFLDRSNIGNAAIAGLNEDLHLEGKQFNTVLAVFFITYILSDLPSNLVLKTFKPNRWIAFLAACWGTVAALTGLTQNYTGLIAARLALGLFEGGLVPGIVVYLCGMYKRHEMLSRMGFLSAATSFSGIVGGVLASAITKNMNGVGGLASWRWIFIVEGVGTVIIAIVAAFLLPGGVATAWFFTKEERECAIWRLKQDKDLPYTSDTMETTVESQDKEKDETVSTETTNVRFEVDVLLDEGFEWREIRRGIFNIQTCLTSLALLGMAVNLYSFLFFFPTIVTGLGYSGPEAQLHTVPPYIVAAAVIIIVCILSDRLKLRGPLLLMITPLTIVGYILTIAGKTNVVRYVGCCFIAAGAYTSTPCIIALLANNSSGYYKRAAAIGVQIASMAVGGFIGTFLYTSDQKPRYIRGHGISMGFAILVWIVVAINVAYCMWENKARKEGRRKGNIEKYKAQYEAGLTQAPIGDRHPDFRFTL